MDRKQIEQQLKEFLTRSRVKRAFYLSGEWGVGKTTLVRNFLCNDIKDDNGNQIKAIYVSLNGLSSISEVKNRIILGEHPNLSYLIDSKLIKILNKLGKASKNSKNLLGEKNTEVIESVTSLDLTLEDFYNIKSNTIIFDDIERCLISIESVFGYFDYLISNDIKLIIIGNESEIKNINNINNRSINKMVISNLLTQDADIKNNIQKIESNMNLFNDPSKYEMIKEKVVAVTTKLDFDANIFFDEILPKFKNNKLSKLILKERNFITEMLIDLKSKNLRICDDFLIRLEAIDNSINKGIKSLEEKTQKNILGNVLGFTIAASSKSSIEDLRSTLKKHNLTLYPSIKDYCTDYNLDKTKLSHDILRFSDKKADIQISHYKALSDYWPGLETEFIKKNIFGLLDDYQNGLFEIKDYYNVLTLFCLYKFTFEIDPNFNVQKILDSMLKNIEKSKEIIDFDTDIAYLNQSSKYSHITNQLIKAIENKQNEAHIAKINELFFKNNFDCDKTELENEVFKIRGFLEHISIDSLIERIKSSNNISLVNLTSIFSYLYNSSNIFDILTNEHTNLSLLKNKLSTITIQNDVIKKSNLNNLSLKISEYTSRSEPKTN